MKTTPIFLQSSVSLLPGTLAQFAAQDLQHPFNQHMLIRSIQFSLLWSDAIGFITNIGNSVRFQLRLGRIGITGGNSYVPMWSFGKEISNLLEAIWLTQGGVQYHRDTFTWVLPRPLLVPAYSAQIAVATRTSGDSVATADATTAVTARISYSGVALPKGFRLPDTFDVPYVSAFCDATTGNTGHSNEIDLKNGFDHPMKIQRLIGRLQYKLSEGGTRDIDYLGIEPTVQILDSRGDYIVNPHAQFNEVFDVLGRDMPVRSVLEPGQNFAIDINGKLNSGGTLASDSDSVMFPTVSMIGHHQMPVREI